MLPPIRIGLLGCSAIAERSVLPAVLQTPAFQLTAIASRDRAKAATWAARFGGQPCSYTELLETADVDAVYVSVPVGLHADWGLQVIQANKHLLLEKTFTSTCESATAIIELAKQRRRVAMEALVYVFHPLFQQVRALVKAGEIGTVRHIQAVFGFPMLPANDIRHDAQLGGGAILDALIYPLSLCLHLGPGRPTRFTSQIQGDAQYAVDLRGFLQLEWPTCSAQIAYGFGLEYRNAYTVWGEKGYVSVERGFTRPPTLPAEIMLQQANTQRCLTLPAANHFTLMLEAFATAIHNPHLSTVNQGTEILERLTIIEHMGRQWAQQSREGQ